METFDFKWWIMGIALGMWMFPILLRITNQRAKRLGQELHSFQGSLRSLLDQQSLPVIVDIDQNGSHQRGATHRARQTCHARLARSPRPARPRDMA